MKNKILPYIFSAASVIPQFSFSQCISNPENAASFGTEALGGATNWNGCPNVLASDNNRSDAGYLLGVLSSATTDGLKTQNFGFSIPTGTIICGIQLTVERRGQGIIIGSSIKDNVVRLVKDNVTSGANYASASSWNNSDAIATYGGPGDLWGNTWTPEDINDPDFGCIFSAQLNSGLASVFLEAQVDYIQATVYYDIVPLPIELANFEVSVIEKKKVKADWTTESEHNNFYFEVQRSANGTDWKSIKTLDGAGNSSEPVSYSFIDQAPMHGVSFYRLKQTDFDGTMKYGEIKSIHVIPDTNMIRVGPIPAENTISLTCLKNADATLTLCIYDLSGNLVKKTEPFEIKKDVQLSIEIPIDELHQGMYFYKAVMGSEVVAGKIVKN